MLSFVGKSTVTFGTTTSSVDELIICSKVAIVCKVCVYTTRKIANFCRPCGLRLENKCPSQVPHRITILFRQSSVILQIAIHAGPS